MENHAYMCSKCGFVLPLAYKDKCIKCGNTDNIIYLELTEKEANTSMDISQDPEFILAMNKLKQDDIIEFKLKMKQFGYEEKYRSQPQPQDNTPKCPTCGSPNVKKISATKRFVSTGILGLASSTIGKSMECNNCGAKW